MTKRLPAAAQAADAGVDEAAVRKQAVSWYARLCSGQVSEAEHAAWRRWRDDHPAHGHAWQRLEAGMAAVHATLEQVPAHIASPALRQSGQARRRRQALGAMAGLACAGALGYGGWRHADGRYGQALLAAYRTGVGEQQRLTLDDGALLVLNTDSAVDVHYSATARTLHLWRGEIFIETAHARQPAYPATDVRPFTVQTAHGSVTALGTRFTVRQFDDYTEVTVLEHAVALRSGATQQQPLIVQAGATARLTRAGAGALAPADDHAGQWHTVHLLVNDRPLAEVVTELARYRHGRLACDPAVAGLRISGVYPLDDTDRALTLLTQALPLRQRSLTRYWVTLAPR